MKLDETKDALERLWNYERDGKPNEEWIRPQIFFKTIYYSVFREQRRNVLYSIKEIIRSLEEEKILVSFFFSYQSTREAKGRFEFDPDDYFSTMLDVSIWVKEKEYAKEIVEKVLSKTGNVADFGFWHFGTKHTSYSNDPELFYKIVSRIYEMFCRLLFEKSDSTSSKNLVCQEGFNDIKIFHRILNSQGMNRRDEARFAILFAFNRWRLEGKIPGPDFTGQFLENVNKEVAFSEQIEQLKEKYYCFPLHVKRSKGILRVSGEWGHPREIPIFEWDKQNIGE
jgi:hypothetical protein